jgi:hypothetical protein
MAVTKEEHENDSLKLNINVIDSESGSGSYESYEFPSASSYSNDDLDAPPSPIASAPKEYVQVEESDYHSFKPTGSESGSIQQNTRSASPTTSSTPTGTTPEDNKRQVGAGMVAAIILLPMFGPVLAGVAGVAAAYGSTQPGAAGDACRAAGDVALTAKEKAMEVNNKHDIVNRSKQNVDGVVSNVRDADKHDILGKIGKAVQLVVANVAVAFAKMTEKLKKKRRKNASDHRNDNCDGIDEDSYVSISKETPPLQADLVGEK